MKKGTKTVAVATLGCKVNQFESASFLSDFVEQGLEQVPFSQAADIYVINTCAVTAKAAAQSRQMIRRAQRANPSAKIVVTGCYAQVEPDTIREITRGDCSCLVANHQKHHLVATALNQTAPDFDPEIGREKEISPLRVKRFAGRSRPFLKIQDGCNNFCSYCIVPHARGRSRSLAPEAVLAQARQFVAAGYREMVVTGIHVGAYGRDLCPRVSLTGILEQLARATPGIRYRISSLEPSEISTELLRLMAETPALMDHLHIPLQSGDDIILKQMRRCYSTREFKEIVLAVRQALPAAAIGVDLLTGFPGEDEQAFYNTCELIDQLPVTYLHVFPYSRRPSTPAATMAGQVGKATRDERVAVLRQLGEKKKIAFYRSQLGTLHQVLVEGGRHRPGLLKGFSGNYIPVTIKGPAPAANQVLTVRLEKLLDDGTVLGTTFI
ncbi:MAG: tRNA (N(6)-L-threonylcarbamoyladenosine(37)-C(2))-methylthiotransferase MtaB [Desulfobacterales bacterium]|nr:tRNA (N(6)-L-threonylcarbamoyladenosine(37)-C(2))-methylthiotransferase MtaB [Desulfobacterales bacterium]